jgi:2,3,4,5-tetrahydropyridine-2,6-dicarboxylate N-acetyltransferase
LAFSFHRIKLYRKLQDEVSKLTSLKESHEKLIEMQKEYLDRMNSLDKISQAVRSVYDKNLAIINIGAQIGENTMIDMNAVIGGRAEIGRNCHIGAGAIVAGVIEPPSAQPVVIEDNVMIGANAVILEGIRIGKGSIVAAGSVVLSDVEPFSVVAGVPAKFVKHVDEKTKSKTQLIDELRKLEN